MLQKAVLVLQQSYAWGTVFCGANESHSVPRVRAFLCAHLGALAGAYIPSS